MNKEYIKSVLIRQNKWLYDWSNGKCDPRDIQFDYYTNSYNYDYVIFNSNFNIHNERCAVELLSSNKLFARNHEYIAGLIDYYQELPFPLLIIYELIFVYVNINRSENKLITMKDIYNELDIPYGFHLCFVD